MILTTKRTSVWMSSTDIASLTDIVVLFKETTSDKALKSIAEDVLAEFGVALSRVKSTGFQHAALAKVLGFDKNSVPLRLSFEEMQLLKSLPISDDVRSRIPSVEEV